MGEKCLLIQYSMDRTGSTVSGLQICEALLKLGYSVTVVYSSDGPLRAEYEKLGAKTLCHRAPHWLLPGPSWRSSLLVPRLLMSAISFAATIVRAKYSLVYGNNILAAYAMFAAIILQQKAIWHIREGVENEHSQLKYPILGKTFISFLIRRVSKVVFVSKSLQREFCSDNDYAESKVIYNALPNQLLSARQENRIPSNDRKIVIGIPGTIRPEKGIEFLIGAISKHSKSTHNMRFIITGTLSTSYAKKIQKEVASAPVTDRIQFIGEVDDMPSFYNACDFVCVPSPYETFGRTIVEAGASNRAVICCSKGGAQEIIGKSERGLYVEYGDDAALVEALMLLSNNIQLRNFFANELRSWVLQNATFDGFFQEFKQIATSATSKEQRIDD